MSIWQRWRCHKIPPQIAERGASQLGGPATDVSLPTRPLTEAVHVSEHVESGGITARAPDIVNSNKPEMGGAEKGHKQNVLEKRKTNRGISFVQIMLFRQYSQKFKDIFLCMSLFRLQG